MTAPEKYWHQSCIPEAQICCSKHSFNNNRKIMKNLNILKLFATIAIGAIAASSASAAVLNGDIKFAGAATLDAAAASATKITFGSSATVAIGSTGDYAGIPNGTTATFANELDFNSVGFVGDISVTNLWSVTYSGVTYCYDLNRLTSKGVSGAALIINSRGDA